MSAIECRGLSRRYSRLLALDGLDLTVAEGAVYGFLGLNGAGKTTTIRLLTGLARPSAGSVRLFGRDLRAQPAATRRLFGYLPEEPAFYPWMTPRETLRYAARLQGLSKKESERSTGEQLQSVGLNEVAGRRVAGFSRGMRQRLGLAAALVHGPRILLLDEPASALDPAGRSEILQLIDRLRGTVTVFMSTHILSDVDRVCDTVGIIDHGRLVVEAGRDELRQRYARPVYEIEFDELPESGPVRERIDHLADRIEAAPRVERVTREGPVLRVHLPDPEAARGWMLETAAGCGLAVRRVERMRPSIEDVFLRLTGALEER